MKEELAKVEAKAPAAPEPSVALMLQTMVERGITGESVAAFSQLCALKERMEDKQAERDFAAALTALQGETIRVVATKKVEEKTGGTCRYKFAPYEEIMKKVQPLLTAHGFSITFDTQTEDLRLSSICTLTHKGGHSRSNKFAVRYGKPPGSSDAQGDMSTKSYAKRGALCDALNISIEHDTDGDDARGEGAFISDKEAFALQDWAETVGADKAKFLALAGAETFETIREDKLEMLQDALRKKEQKNKQAGPPSDKLL